MRLFYICTNLPSQTLNFTICTNPTICLQPQRGLELCHQLFAEPVLPYWWVNSAVLVTNTLSWRLSQQTNSTTCCLFSNKLSISSCKICDCKKLKTCHYRSTHWQIKCHAHNRGKPQASVNDQCYDQCYILILS